MSKKCLAEYCNFASKLNEQNDSDLFTLQILTLMVTRISIDNLIKVVNIFEKGGAIINFDKLLLESCQDLERDIYIDFFIEKGANINYIGIHGRSCLHHLAGQENFDRIKQFVEMGANTFHRDDNFRDVLWFLENVEDIEDEGDNDDDEDNDDDDDDEDKEDEDGEDVESAIRETKINEIKKYITNQQIQILNKYEKMGQNFEALSKLADGREASIEI